MLGWPFGFGLILGIGDTDRKKASSGARFVSLRLLPDNRKQLRFTRRALADFLSAACEPMQKPRTDCGEVAFRDGQLLAHLVRYGRRLSTLRDRLQRVGACRSNR